MRVCACFHLCLSAALPDLPPSSTPPSPTSRPPPPLPITVHTLGLNTNTAYCLPAYSCQSPHPHVYSNRPCAVSNQCQRTHPFPAAACYDARRERMAGFPCKQGSGAISLFSNGRVLTKHSRACLCGGFTRHIPGAPAQPDYLAKVGLAFYKTKSVAKNCHPFKFHRIWETTNVRGLNANSLTSRTEQTDANHLSQRVLKL